MLHSIEGYGRPWLLDGGRRPIVYNGHSSAYETLQDRTCAWQSIRMGLSLLGYQVGARGSLRLEMISFRQMFYQWNVHS